MQYSNRVVNFRKSILNYKIWLINSEDTATKVAGEENRDSAMAVDISNAVLTLDDRATVAAKISKDPGASTTEAREEISITKDFHTMINSMKKPSRTCLV